MAYWDVFGGIAVIAIAIVLGHLIWNGLKKIKWINDLDKSGYDILKEGLNIPEEWDK